MQRTLDSFADHIITRASRGKDSGLWYAVLDVPLPGYVADPDFSTCCRTKAEAVAACAKKIREDAKGIGKYAPHDLVTPSYDLHYRLMPHWEAKEGAATQP